MVTGLRPGPQLPFLLTKVMDRCAVRNEMAVRGLWYLTLKTLRGVFQCSRKEVTPTKILYGCAAVLGTFSNSPPTSVLKHGKMLNPAGGLLA
jgi:hypothetical protein